jgi:hypothetical protein
MQYEPLLCLYLDLWACERGREMWKERGRNESAQRIKEPEQEVENLKRFWMKR